MTKKGAANMRGVENRSGQVILETAMVLVAIAVVALSSMALFANFNLNLIDRSRLFKDSRREALNSSTATSAIPNHRDNPVTYLDYSPNTDIGIGDGGLDPGGFDESFFEDARLAEAERLLEEADTIMNVTLPYKTRQAYNLLAPPRGHWNRISKTNATTARNLCNEMLQARTNYNQYSQLSAPRAYDDFFEDMDGHDADGDHFLGAVGLMQQALDVPVENGPFDPTPTEPANDPDALAARVAQNAQNRTQLQQAVNGIKAQQVGVGQLLNDLFKPKMTYVRDQLNLALTYWDSSYIGYWQRITYLQNARGKLGEMLDFLSDVENAIVDEATSRLIKDAYNLVQNPTYNNIVSARDKCQSLLALANVANEPVLKSIIENAKSDLVDALSNWSDTTLRDQRIALAKDKLEALNDIIQLP